MSVVNILQATQSVHIAGFKKLDEFICGNVADTLNTLF